MSATPASARRGWQRLTYPASVEGGGTRRVSVVLHEPQVALVAAGPLRGALRITGPEVNTTGERIGRVHVIFADPDEVSWQPLVQDLITERLVTPARESADSRAMRGGSR